jgi:uncharacterized membrane protein YphA (DoxX/SURF4 family)
MKSENLIEESETPNQPKWLALLRIGLGIILLWKGISFFRDSSQLESIINSGGLDTFTNNTQAIAFIITYLNLLGGVFIAVGFLTRLMAAIQIPIIFGAIIFINGKAGLSFSNTELILSVIVFILLFIFLMKGSGLISADEYFKSYNKAGEESGHTKNFFK